MIHNRFSPIRNKYSPKVAVIQSNLDYHSDNNKLENEVEAKGYLNCHLCLDAQTEMIHTEPDASYKIISVPKNVNRNDEKNLRPNKGKFEFMLNNDEIVSLSLSLGTIIVYSGYMLTHRQQIIINNEKSPPFINLVAYNFKRLFSNLLESFRRDIDMDKKTLSKKMDKMKNILFVNCFLIIIPLYLIINCLSCR